jgi:hypothetical protein
MKILDKIQAIFDEYDLKPLELPAGQKNVYTYLREFPEKKDEFGTDMVDRHLYEKYHKYISQGHYGFSIGIPIILSWVEIIDKILQICVKADHNFEIHQIKLKFGGICFYVHSEIIEDINDVEILISKTLRDKALIY